MQHSVAAACGPGESGGHPSCLPAACPADVVSGSLFPDIHCNGDVQHCGRTADSVMPSAGLDSTTQQSPRCSAGGLRARAASACCHALLTLFQGLSSRTYTVLEICNTVVGRYIPAWPQQGWAAPHNSPPAATPVASRSPWPVPAAMPCRCFFRRATPPFSVSHLLRIGNKLPKR